MSLSGLEGGKRGKKTQAGKKGEVPSTGWLWGPFDLQRRPLSFSTFSPPSQAHLELEPSRSTKQIYTYNIKGDHPFRDDSPRGGKSIYTNQLQGIKVKKGNVEVGSMGLSTPNPTKTLGCSFAPMWYNICKVFIV